MHSSQPKYGYSGSGAATLAALRAEHTEIEALMSRYARTRSVGRRAKLLPAICTAVRLHLTVEAGLFVPAVAHLTGDQALLRTVGAEYATILSLINELAATRPGNEAREWQVKQLRLRVTEHIERSEGIDGVLRTAERLELQWCELGLHMSLRRDALARSWGA